MVANVMSKLQQKFNLFAVGDLCIANVYAITDKEPQLKLKGGAVGIIPVDKNEEYRQKGLKLQVGNVVNVSIIKIEEGIPFLELTPAYVLANTPQIGVCKIIGTKGVVVEFPFQDRNLGYYPLSEFETAEGLTEGQKVSCEGLSEEEDYFLIGMLKPLPPETQVQEVVKVQVEKRPLREKQEVVIDPNFEFPKPWSEEQIQKSLTTKDTIAVSDNGLYRVGHCYLAHLGPTPDIVLLDDKQKAQVKKRNGIDPKLGEYILVRIIKMYSFGYIDVEYLDVPDKEYVANFQREFSRIRREFKIVEKNGFKFNFRDDDIFLEGIKNHSEKCFEQYWLGYLYEVGVSEGKPLFENRKVGRLEVKTLASDVEYRDGDTIYCQLVYIEPQGKKAVLTVRVVYVVK